MISFAQPWFLLAIPFVWLFAVWFAKRKSTAILFSDITLFDGLPRGRAVWWPKLQLFLLGMIPSLLWLAIANPRTPDRRTRLPVEGIAIAIVVDTSGSMAEVDFAKPTGEMQSRLQAAINVFQLFVDGGETGTGEKFEGRKDDQLALIAFAAWPETVCPLTLNRAVITQLLSTLKPKIGPDAGTNIGDAIAESLIRMESIGSHRKVIVLLSDGEHNIAIDRADPPLKPRQAAQLAADLGVAIYAIDCGGMKAEDAEALERRANGRQTMQSIATMTGGKMFAADDVSELQMAIAEIDRLEKRPSDAYLYRRFHEWGWLCGVAAMLATVLLFAINRFILPQ